MDQMSVCDVASVPVRKASKEPCNHTNVQQDSATFSLVDDVVLKDLVIQGSGLGVS